MERKIINKPTCTGSIAMESEEEKEGQTRKLLYQNNA
jgi:hypothetical protein